MEDKYVELAVNKTLELLAIDSPAGYCKKAISYLKDEFEKIGFETKITNKGGLFTMAEKAYYVTEEGLAALQAELEDLKVNRRKEVAEKIKEALSFGDLSENSEYDEAKNDQAILEARIADLEVMVSNARVIEKENLAADTVHIGSSVFVKTKRADGSEAERSFSIVGSNEANPRQGKISDESAVGKALVGAKVGQTVEVETPAGIVEYTIISVS